MEAQLIRLIIDAAKDWDLRPGLCCGLVEVESSGICSVTRFEPKFLDKYVRRNRTTQTWHQQQMLATSFGLTQIMCLTAVELGFTGNPQDLLIPEINLKFGFKKLKACFTGSKDERNALLKFNGGGDINYPDRVLKASVKYLGV